MVYWMPKTRIGKISFWLTMLGVALVYIPYWLAMAFDISSPFSGFVAIGLLVIFGICSMISIIRYKDRAISLFISSLAGLFGILLVIGEFLFPH